MAPRSAGLLMFRGDVPNIEVLLIHPGGPHWAKKDDGGWSIPKGGIGADEDPLAAAIREMAEETGVAAREPYLPLGAIRQRGGKEVLAWAFRGDCDAAAIRSNTFSMEWPPRSGRVQEFPEVDRAGWFEIGAARVKMLAAQTEFLDRLVAALSSV